MRKLLIIILFPISIINAQELDGINSVGFGWSNTGLIIGSAFNENKIKPAFHIDYKNKYEELSYFYFKPININCCLIFFNLFYYSKV